MLFITSGYKAVAEFTIPLYRSALLHLLLTLILLHFFLVTRPTPTPLILAAVLSRLENGVTLVASSISLRPPSGGFFFFRKLKAHGLSNEGALTGSAVRIAAIFSQIRASSTFRTLDHGLRDLKLLWV